MENYKTNLDDDVRMLEKYGGIDPQNGDYLPFFCRGCDGPLLGHIAEERECQGPKMSAEQREILNDRIRNNEYFDVQLKFLDKRPSEIRCQPCNLVFQNAYRRRQHDKDKHGGKRAEEVSNESLCQELVNKIAENLITKCRKKKIKDNFEYMIANMMIEKAEKAGKLTKEERVKLQDSIEVEEMNDRVPKSENEVFEKLRKEFKKLKIENNRDEKVERVDTKNIHYGERKSRFEEWKRFKSNPEYNDYERSGSMTGFWRSKSGNNYKRAPSRTPSRRFDRSGSFRRDKNHVTLAEKVTKIEQSVKNIENILAKKETDTKQNETKETLYIKEIRYVKEETNEMVLDSGAPVATVGDDWLEEYIKEHEIDERKLVKTKINQKFRFGPSQIYTTKEVTEIPITLKNAKTDEYVKTKIPVYVVEAKNVPLLIGKNILNKWEAAWNIPKGKLCVKIDGKPLEIEVQEKSGGHSVVVIDPEPG